MHYCHILKDAFAIYVSSSRNLNCSRAYIDVYLFPVINKMNDDVIDGAQCILAVRYRYFPVLFLTNFISECGMCIQISYHEIKSIIYVNNHKDGAKRE